MAVVQMSGPSRPVAKCAAKSSESASTKQMGSPFRTLSARHIASPLP
jgi:hypothetical protein